MKVTNQQIKHLFDLKFPSYQKALAGLSGASEDAGKLRKYIDQAEAYLHETTALFDENPAEFAAQVRAAELKHMGPLHTIQQCAQVVADQMLPDDGYEETKLLRLKYRDLCEERLQYDIRIGILPYLNTNTLKNFDANRFSDAFFPLDGLVRASSLQTWLKPKISEIMPATVPPMGKESAVPDAPISDETKRELAKYGTSTNLEPAPASPANTGGFVMSDGGRGELASMLWAMADEIAHQIREGDSYVPLNRVCIEMCKTAFRKKHSDLLHGQKGWHTSSWLKGKGRLKGWTDPAARK